MVRYKVYEISETGHAFSRVVQINQIFYFKIAEFSLAIVCCLFILVRLPVCLIYRVIGRF
jgi:hypothetical protein